MIEGINSAKLELARNFFWENGETGKYELLGIKAFLDPLLVTKIATIVIEFISNKVFKDAALIIAKSKHDIPLAYEIAKRLGITFAYPIDIGNGISYLSEKYNKKTKVPCLVVSYSFEESNGPQIDSDLEDPRFEVIAWACIVKYETPITKHKAPLYALYTKDQMNQIIEYYLSMNLKERREKFVKAVSA